MNTQAIIGIDVGTTAVKSVILSTTGMVLGSARAEVEVSRPSHDRAEQDMNLMWSTAANTITAALAEAGDVELLAVSITGQGDGAWLVDAEGRPTGPAALWLDGRGSNRLLAWQEDGRAQAVRDTTGSALFPGALPLLLEEIEAEDPQRIARSAHQLNCKDWIRFRITGRIATDPTEASRTYLDVRTGAYSTDLIERLGHGRFAHLLPLVNGSTSIAGEVTEEASIDTGLPVGLPVATGMVDTPVGGLGLGVTGPGQAYAIIGTTSFVGAINSEVTASNDEPVITLSFDGNGSVLECFAPMNGTPNLDWAAHTLNLGELDWDEIETIASEAPPGAGGVMYLPYASSNGERAPFVDPNASAAWLNLSSGTSRNQMVRAVYEGLAQSLRESMNRLGVAADAVVRLSGGGAKSPAICQALADVTGRTIERAHDAELGARGSAALALVAVGAHLNLESAMSALATETEQFHPSPQTREIYDEQAAAFTATRDALRTQWSALRRLRDHSHSLLKGPS